MFAHPELRATSKAFALSRQDNGAKLLGFLFSNLSGQSLIDTKSQALFRLI
jgi:hypothetical protein